MPRLKQNSYSRTMNSFQLTRTRRLRQRSMQYCPQKNSCKRLGFLIAVRTSNGCASKSVSCNRTQRLGKSQIALNNSSSRINEFFRSVCSIITATIFSTRTARLRAAKSNSITSNSSQLRASSSIIRLSAVITIVMSTLMISSGRAGMENVRLSILSLVRSIRTMARSNAHALRYATTTTACSQI